MFYITERWLGGTLTNWVTMQNSIRNLTRLEEGGRVQPGGGCMSKRASSAGQAQRTQ